MNIGTTGPIMTGVTLVAAGGCGWDTRRGKSPAPAANEPIVLDKYDLYAVIDELQHDNLPVGQCTLDEIKFNAADNTEAAKNAKLTRDAVAYRVLIKFDEFKNLNPVQREAVVIMVADELGKKEGPASLESLLNFFQSLSYDSYCKTHDHWYTLVTYGQLPEAVTLKNFNVSDVKALIEKVFVPLSITPNTGMAGGEPLAVTLSHYKLPANPYEAKLTVDFGAGITVGDITAAGQDKINVEITIDENAKPGNHNVIVKQGEDELVRGLFDVTKPAVEAKPKIIFVEKSAPAPAPAKEEPAKEEEEEAPKLQRVHKPKPAPAPTDDFGAAPQL